METSNLIKMLESLEWEGGAHIDRYQTAKKVAEAFDSLSDLDKASLQERVDAICKSCSNEHLGIELTAAQILEN